MTDLMGALFALGSVVSYFATLTSLDRLEHDTLEGRKTLDRQFRQVWGTHCGFLALFVLYCVLRCL